MGVFVPRHYESSFKTEHHGKKSFQVQQPHESNDIVLEFKEPSGKLSPEQKSITSPKAHGIIKSLLISLPTVFFFSCANYFDRPCEEFDKLTHTSYLALEGWNRLGNGLPNIFVGGLVSKDRSRWRGTLWRIFYPLIFFKLIHWIAE